MKTVKEVAEILRTNPKYVRDLINSGKLKAVKKGNMWFVDDVDLELYLVNLEE